MQPHRRKALAALSALGAGSLAAALLLAPVAAATTSKGAPVSVRTLAAVRPASATSAPTVVTEPPTSVSLTTATLAGTVNPNGLQSTYQFQYGTSTSYGSVSPASPVGVGAGTTPVTVTAALSNLTAKTTYDFRLVGINSSGTTYGQNMTFTTGAPTVVTGPATAVTGNSATLGGTVNPNGTATTYQFQYGTSTSYGSVSPASPQAIGSGTSPVSVTASLTGLKVHTTYDFRLVGINANGTTYGQNMTFSTDTPTVVTLPATSVTVSTATLDGTVDPNGLPTTFQFQYGTSTGYGLVSPAVPQAIGSGTTPVTVIADITGLSPDTTYDFRLVGINASGTVDGANETFLTGAPTVVTLPATSVTVSTATLNGTVDPNGLPTTFQFQYGTSTAYGLVSPAIPQAIGSGTTPVTVTADLTGLGPDTTYDFRLVAINASGTTDGANVTFFTGAPTVTTGPATSVTVRSATLNGTIDPNGLQTTFQFQYGTSTAYGAVSPPTPESIGSGTVPVAVTADLTGLSPDTTYDFRLVAINASGTTDGANATFTTPAVTVVPPTPVTPAGEGYVWFNSSGAVVTYGNVAFQGDLYTEGYTGLSGSNPLPSPIVGAAPLRDGLGYYLVAANGTVYPFGKAPYLGSRRGEFTNGPITAIATAPGRGYYLVSSLGSVWNFGAPFYGSLRDKFTNGPITAIAIAADGHGYYLVSSLGSVWNFGAPWYGSLRDKFTNGPITGIGVSPRRGYYLTSAAGSIWNFAAPWYGSLRTDPPTTPLRGIWVNEAGTAYMVFDEAGTSFGFAS